MPAEEIKQQLFRSRIAVSTIFLIAGLALSCWAPMVPIVKEKMQLNESELGLLMLLIGVGALVMMPVTGYLAQHWGTKRLITVAAIFIAPLLPIVLMVNSVWALAVALLFFGACIGVLDVAMNSHAVIVQNLYNRAIMSSMHGLFSTGGLLGAVGIGLLMKMNLSPAHAAMVMAVLLIIMATVSIPYLFDAKKEKSLVVPAVEEQPGAEKGKSISWLKGSVFFIGWMCFAMFLAEGAMLDWSAVFLRENRGVEEAFTGMGYAAFSIAMAVMRLTGDRIVIAAGNKNVIVGGAVLAATGLAVAIYSPVMILTLVGFAILGIGCANIVPVLFSEAGRLKNIPAPVAITVVTTIGYTGQLAGPALLGFIAHWKNLPFALTFCAGLLLMVGVSYFIKTLMHK